MNFAPLLMEGLTPQMQVRAETELGETPLVRKDSLKKIKEFIEREEDFQPFIDDKFLLMFLRCKKHDVQKAYESLKNFYRFKEKNSRVLTDFLPSEHKKVINGKGFTALLSRDNDGRAVVIVRLGQFNWSEVTMEDLVATSFTIGSLLARLEATSVCGCVIVIDLKDFTMGMVFKVISLKLWFFLLGCLQNCFPLRIKAIHVINEPGPYRAIVNLLKLAMPKKLRDRNCFPLRIKAIHVINEPGPYRAIVNLLKLAMPKKLRDRNILHGDNMESFHRYLSTEILPEEFAGKAGPIDNRELFDFALRHESFVEEMNKCGFKK